MEDSGIVNQERKKTLLQVDSCEIFWITLFRFYMQNTTKIYGSNRSS